MKESTRKVFKMHGSRVHRAAHNYIYFVFYDKYVKIFLAAGRYLVKRFGTTMLLTKAFRNVYENYHAKVLTYDGARKILTLNRDISLSADKAKKIIPFSAANRIIFQEADFIAVMDCPCRLSRKQHCEPLNVCMAVGRTTAEFWLDHCEKYHVRKITQAQALEILEVSANSGRIISAWLKTETGGRTGVICSCCPCCCGGIEGMKLARRLPGDIKISNIVSSGYSVAIDTERCLACGQCVEACAFDACSSSNGGRPVYNWDACLGCGVCVARCAAGARSMVADPAKGLPLDVGQSGA
jgi:Pyruvate/2-oxoacid:ferredoxin oxidoreductase delta subunit